MLKISLIVIGDKMPAWVSQGYHEYAKRIRGRIRLELVEIAAVKRGKNADLWNIMQAEENKIRSAIAKDTRIIALDRNGTAQSTLNLSEKFKNWLDTGEQVALLVGGPEGLSDGFLQQADEVWSLSELTFAHPVVRVVMAEQIYRAFSIVEGLPYHR